MAVDVKIQASEGTGDSLYPEIQVFYLIILSEIRQRRVRLTDIGKTIK